MKLREMLTVQVKLTISFTLFELQVVFDLRPARLTTARLYDRFPGKARQLYR